MSSILKIAGPTTTPAGVAQAVTNGPGPAAQNVQTPEPPVAALLSDAGEKLLLDIDRLWTAKDAIGITRAVETRLAGVTTQGIQSLNANEVRALYCELYILQNRMLAVSNKLTIDGEGPVKTGASTLLQRIGVLTTAAFTRSVELANEGAKEPPVRAWQVFKNTLKKPGFHTPSMLESAYLEKALDFIAKGGDFANVQHVTIDFLKGLKSGELCEWAVNGWDEARITRTQIGVAPNHTLLAGGADVLSAGTLRVIKNEAGDLEHVIVGTFSGHYRPSFESLDNMVRHVMAAGVPRERISIQEGEAGGMRAIPDMLFKLTGLEGAEAQRAAAKLVADAQRWMPYEPVAKPEKPGVAPGKLPQAAAQLGRDLNVALYDMRTKIKNALDDGMVLSAGDEAGIVARAIDRALTLAESAGNSVAYGQALSALTHLVGLAAPHIDEPARTTLAIVHARWKDHEFGKGAHEPADVLSARPASGRRARIIATVNPKSDISSLQQMIAGGMDVARLNLARGTTAEHRALIAKIREAAVAVGRPITVMVDLPGPKIRLGTFANHGKLEKNDIQLDQGARVMLTTAKLQGSASILPVEYAPLARDVKVGDPILLNDGKVRLRATRVSVDVVTGAGVVDAVVEVPGIVWDRKGINLPGSRLSVPTFTDDDKKLLAGVIDVVDVVAESFTRTAQDVLELKAEMVKLGRLLPVVAKIERPEGVDNLEAIANVADAMMVARGDLAAEIGTESVPGAERAIYRAGGLYGKPVILATEVFSTMASNPTRATHGETAAAYAAVFDHGASGLMLASETSGGTFPVGTVQAAARVIERAEQDRQIEVARSSLPGNPAPRFEKLKEELERFGQAVASSAKGGVVSEPAVEYAKLLEQLDRFAQALHASTARAA